MGLTMKQRQAVTRQMAPGYKRATKKQKGAILDTLTELTTYNRSYAARPACSRQGPAATRAATVPTPWMQRMCVPPGPRPKR